MRFFRDCLQSSHSLTCSSADAALSHPCFVIEQTAKSRVASVKAFIPPRLKLPDAGVAAKLM